MSEFFGTDRNDYIARRMPEIRDHLLFQYIWEDYYANAQHPVPENENTRFNQIKDAMDYVASEEFDNRRHVPDDELFDKVVAALKQALDISEGNVANVTPLFGGRKTASATTASVPDAPRITVTEAKIEKDPQIDADSPSPKKIKPMLTTRGLDIVRDIRSDLLAHRRLLGKITQAMEANPEHYSKDPSATVDTVLRMAAEKVARKEEDVNGEQHYVGIKLLTEMNIALDTLHLPDKMPEPEEMPLDTKIYFGWGNRYTQQARNILNALDASDRETLINAAIPKVRYMNEIPSWMREDDCIAHTADMLLLQAAEMLLKERDNGVVIEDSDIPNKLEDTIIKGKFEHKPIQIGSPD